MMKLIALSGQRAAALAQYERCCHILEDEFAIAPSSETQALFEEIRDVGIAPMPQTAAVNANAALLLLPTSLVGRTHELDVLVLRLSDKACRLITIVGPG